MALLTEGDAARNASINIALLTEGKALLTEGKYPLRQRRVLKL